MTPVKVIPKFECNIYSDIDFQSAISVSSIRNSQSFIVLTERLAFVYFSSPDVYTYGGLISRPGPVTLLAPNNSVDGRVEKPVLEGLLGMCSTVPTLEVLLLKPSPIS